MKNIKNIVEKIPYPIGKILSLIPFPMRLGKNYNYYVKQVETSKFWDDENYEQYAIDKFKKIYEYSLKHFPFYQNFYKQHNVDNLIIKSLDDIRKIPIITKKDLREHLSDFSGAYKLNTGGTTGTPFAFYVDKYAWAREWAHMHKIWDNVEYNYQDLKLTLRGKNLGSKKYIYNPIHNEFILNTYMPLENIKNDLLVLFKKYKIKYFHGYPSAIYNFILELEKNFSKDEVVFFLSLIKGLLLSSEFPMPNMIEKFKQYSLSYISWYGHSEMCILAYDKSCSNNYIPFITYGLTEIQNERLIGTSFHNFDMPLIRYDTGDIVKQTSSTKNGLCTSFSITSGRDGDYIEDNNGKKIPLTALIFGRHHKAFDVVEHIQISQHEKGDAVIYLVTSKVLTEELSNLLDLTNVDIKFDIKQIKKPILTKAGKLRLKV